MTIELKYLTAAIILGLVQIFLTAVAGTRQHGLKYAMGPRDEQLPVTGVGGRIVRAYHNFVQSFSLFAAAIMISHLLGAHSKYTELGAALYFWGRLVYVPVYAAGIPVLRTLVWLVSIIGIVLVLLGLF